MSTWSTWKRCCPPSLIIIGGGISRKSDKFLPLLTAAGQGGARGMLNDAGIVGAAMAAHAGVVNAVMASAGH